MTDAIADIFLALAHQERRVLSLLIPNRRVAAPIAQAAGLEVWHFAQDDHRLMFSGWQVACEHDLGLVPTLRLIRRALQADGYWDDRAPADSSGVLHSDATLARIGTRGMTEEELECACGRSAVHDPLGRAIARHVVALVEASDTLAEVQS